METIEEIQGFLNSVMQDGFRGRLLDRGTAWSLMRQDGVLPDDAPHLGNTIDSDLADYGFSVLRAALSLKEKQGDLAVTKRGFEHAAKAFESLIKNSAPDEAEIDFYRIMAAAAYHLASYSAVAYSLLNRPLTDQNTNVAEQALAALILRNFGHLHDLARAWLRSYDNIDENISAHLDGDECDEDEVYMVVLNSSVCRALLHFDFALQTGRQESLDGARTILKDSLILARDTGMVALWWVIRLCINLIDDLWAHSLHVNLPFGDPAADDSYAEMREKFIASLYARKTPEVELWPSQIEAAKRASNVEDDLVVALPTSAGKTRIAEIAALIALSSDKRVLIVTPLRALSAQTERSFRKTFAPLGYSVSSLYGASGVSANDEDALRTKNIVIATPEKLDFALRNDPTLIDDVGLIVLDEGHMIGPTEREIRYEILVQKLLKRTDAVNRRIVCLSAILPDGQQLDDLTAWIRSDAEGTPVKSIWRPTRQRFGAIIWKDRNQSAQLRFSLERDGAFINNFVEQFAGSGGERTPRPRDVKDLTLFSAWRFAEQGKKTLIFISTAKWVSGYGDRAVDLVRRGYIPSLLDNPNDIQRALTVGREWLGTNHPAVKALQIGIAIHHGGLPNPFLRELEILLSEGIIKVIVASPTLSQGLNINAAVLLVPYLTRAGVPLAGEEFANVAGRAGRAFVDVEGLVIHTIFDKEAQRLREWQSLIQSARSRSLKSGLYQVILEILNRLSATGILSREDAFEYLVNSRDFWSIQEPVDPNGDEREPFEHLVEKLDAMVLGLVDALDANADDLPRLLDEALNGSLWARRIAEEGENMANAHKFILQARAKLIWNNTTPAIRKSHYAMGVGLNTGLAIDTMAEELAGYLDAADLASINGDQDSLVISLIALAERLLVVRPFVPSNQNALPMNWRDLLRLWVSGTDVPTIGPDNMHIVEEAFTYRLVWALEALRTRRLSLGWTPEIIAGGAAATLETGVPRHMMALLIRAGLPSRIAAIKSVNDTSPAFVDIADMKEWLESDEIKRLTSAGNWPTAETAAMWQRFCNEMTDNGAQKWNMKSIPREMDRESFSGFRPTIGIPYRVEIDEEDGGIVWICAPDYERLAYLKRTLRDVGPRLYTAEFKEGDTRAHIHRYGLGKAQWSELPEV